jgi:peptide-methionine (S)-S-oxide reductase
MKFSGIILGLILIFGSLNTFAADAPKQDTAIFAGGCFWCMQAAFSELPGVTKVTSGFTGGHVENPTYEQVSAGDTGHVEAIKVDYDPAKVSYDKLLEWFWDNVDPTDPYGQFCDKGSQYAAGIFYMNDAQKDAAEKSFAVKQKKFGDTKLSASIRKAGPFYPAEDYHQDYYKKNPINYMMYKHGCGRTQRLEELNQQK